MEIYQNPVTCINQRSQTVHRPTGDIRYILVHFVPGRPEYPEDRESLNREEYHPSQAVRSDQVMCAIYRVFPSHSRPLKIAGRIAGETEVRPAGSPPYLPCH